VKLPESHAKMFNVAKLIFLLWTEFVCIQKNPMVPTVHANRYFEMYDDNGNVIQYFGGQDLTPLFI
jgi:coproporphyrinogen III oxidase